MPSVLRYTLITLGLPAVVMASYLLSCLMGQTYNTIELWTSGGVGLCFGVVLVGKAFARDRSARRQ
ncbi:hypothetical protein ABIA33_003447 [Streptacidiphilus sp. MAP12-16]|uniref:hypothetical protein n=1 Tax=Streptacidiphilus sp. MAP12-16 TaxID=3156300 RepID=UPI003517EC5D